MTNLADTKTFLKKHYKTNRATVTDATNDVNREIAETLDGDLLRVKAGAECLTWFMPEHWNVQEAYLKEKNGKEIVNFKNHPLHLWSASSPFTGELSYKELESHLYFNKEKPDAIPYHYSYQYDYTAKGWGFCLSYNQFKKLDKNAKYEVVVDTELTKNKNLEIADCKIQGKTDETVFIAAHSCHPGQINDGLLCVALGLDFFKWLKTQPKPYYTYRLIIGPEYFTGAAYVSHSKNVENLKMGIYLDMIANNHPIVFSNSWQGDSFIDTAMDLAVSSTVDEYKAVGYRKMWGNDELFYDGPDYLIPTIGLGRDWYDEYHTHFDNMELVNWSQYTEMLNVLKKTQTYLDKNRIPKRNFKGPVYMSRYGIKPGPYSNRLQEAQILMDDNNSLIDIAYQTDLPFEILDEIVEKLEGEKLIKSRK